VRALLDQISQQRTRSASRPATRKHLSRSATKCKKVLEWMDAHEGNLPVRSRNSTIYAQRSEYLLRTQFNYHRSKTIISSDLRFVLEQIERRMSFVPGTTTCKKVLVWMYGHEMALPKELRKLTTDAQRAEYLLRKQFKYLKQKTDPPPEVLALLDQISRQRARTAARPSTRKLLFSSTTKCKKVMEWMDAHEGNLPVLLSNPNTDAQRAEVILRRQFNYIRSKNKISPELRSALEQRASRMPFVSGTTTCKKVLEWMYGHEMALPREFRKPTTDAQRAEYLLRNQFKYLKRKKGQPPEVLALLDQIKYLSLQVPDLKQCLTVPAWCLSSEDSELCDIQGSKRRRLLVKTKAPSSI
jgi:hypothetical protein